jgi:hypothetical protein
MSDTTRSGANQALLIHSEHDGGAPNVSRQVETLDDFVIDLVAISAARRTTVRGARRWRRAALPVRRKTWRVIVAPSRLARARAVRSPLAHGGARKAAAGDGPPPPPDSALIDDLKQSRRSDDCVFAAILTIMRLAIVKEARALFWDRMRAVKALDRALAAQGWPPAAISAGPSDTPAEAIKPAPQPPGGSSAPPNGEGR